MANPCPAFKGTHCSNCGWQINEGDSVYFVDGDKLCKDCASDADLICECGSFKKEEYDTCYDCSH